VKETQNNGEKFHEQHPQDLVPLCSARIFALPLVAQNANTSTPVTGQTIQDRKENQQDRIANGVKSGELTAGETSNLEKKEAAINQEERDMRKVDNGKLTTGDKKTLTQQQNQVSKQIYKGQA